MQEIGVNPGKNELLGQTRANCGIKAIAKAGNFINIWLALAIRFIQGMFKLGNIGRKRIVALAEGMELVFSLRLLVWIIIYP
jgi:hypothetical protein